VQRCCCCGLSIRQHTSAYVSIRQHTSAYVSIRQHTPAYVRTLLKEEEEMEEGVVQAGKLRQHTSSYASIRQHTSAYVSIPRGEGASGRGGRGGGGGRGGAGWKRGFNHIVGPGDQEPAYVSMRQHASAYVSIRQRTSAYVSIRHSYLWASRSTADDTDELGIRYRSVLTIRRSTGIRYGGVGHTLRRSSDETKESGIRYGAV
jgi:hypothetical protein